MIVTPESLSWSYSKASTNQTNPRLRRSTVRSLNTSEFLSPPKHTFRAPSTQSPSDSTNLPPPRTFHDMGIFTHVPPRRSFFSSSFSVKTGVQNRSAELRKPPPLLFRPTAFWKKTRRSGVTAAAYSPCSFVVRRSTFIAAGFRRIDLGLIRQLWLWSHA
ncbi:hypothetical protein EDC04DRAFT_801460 [Pisolithus marmoratus]|nr:hypothetical protein EDC04DRAFT_801460 [Pisolithus marmoratus]